MSLVPSLKVANLGNTFFYGELFFTLFTAKIFQFLRLSAKFLAVLRLSVNPIETLLSVFSLIETICLKFWSNHATRLQKVHFRLACVAQRCHCLNIGTSHIVILDNCKI